MLHNSVETVCLLFPRGLLICCVISPPHLLVPLVQIFCLILDQHGSSPLFLSAALNVHCTTGTMVDSHKLWNPHASTQFKEKPENGGNSAKAVITVWIDSLPLSMSGHFPQAVISMMRIYTLDHVLVDKGGHNWSDHMT